MAQLSISRAWDESREVLARDGRSMFIVTLALIMLPVAFLGLVEPEALERTPAETYSPSGLATLLQLINGLLALVAQIAIVSIALGLVSSVGDAIRKGGSDLLAVVGSILLIALGVIIFLFVPIVLLVGAGNMPPAAGMSGEEASQWLAALPAGTVPLILALVVAVFAIAMRLSVMVPARVAEGVGPLGMIRRSWALTRGHFWRLLGFFLLFAVAVLVVALVYMLLMGMVGALLFSGAEPMSVGALYVGLVAGLLQAAMTVISSTIVARIYAQLAVTTGVPDVDAG